MKQEYTDKMKFYQGKEYVVRQIKRCFNRHIILSGFKSFARIRCGLLVADYADYLLLKIPHAN